MQLVSKKAHGRFAIVQGIMIIRWIVAEYLTDMRSMKLNYSPRLKRTITVLAYHIQTWW